MKITLPVFAATLLALHAAQATTAYDALNLVEKQKGKTTLDRVLEVRGSRGAPEPRTWRVITEDRDARGGVREFEVQGGKLAGERAPAVGIKGAALNVNTLKLDSEGAHTVAEREAKKVAYAYDYVDYLLHPGSRGGSPVWELRLVDERSGNAATITIAADTGTVLSKEGLAKNAQPAISRRDDPAVQDERDLPPPPPVEERRTEPRGTTRQQPVFIQRAGEKVGGFFDRVGRHMERRFWQIGDKAHNLVTGDNRDSVGPRPRRNSEEPPRATPQPPPAQPRTYRDANGTEFYRPRD